MARTVLELLRVLTICLLLGFTASSLAFAHQAPNSSCSPNALSEIPAARQSAFRQYQKTVESGVFYRELVSKLGNPQSCRKSIDDQNMSLSYTFRSDARLDAHFDSSIEYSEQRMQLPGLTSDSALALLKAAEKDLYGANGCGIQWKRSKRETDDQHPGSSQVVYKGKTCNCQARVVYDHNAIVAVLLQSAC